MSLSKLETKWKIKRPLCLVSRFRDSLGGRRAQPRSCREMTLVLHCIKEPEWLEAKLAQGPVRVILNWKSKLLRKEKYSAIIQCDEWEPSVSILGERQGAKGTGDVKPVRKVQGDWRSSSRLGAGTLSRDAKSLPWCSSASHMYGSGPASSKA